MQYTIGSNFLLLIRSNPHLLGVISYKCFQIYQFSSELS